MYSKYNEIRAAVRTNEFKARQSKRNLKAEHSERALSCLLNDFGNIDRYTSTDDFRICEVYPLSDEAEKVSNILKEKIKYAKKLDGWTKESGRFSPTLSNSIFCNKSDVRRLYRSKDLSAEEKALFKKFFKGKDVLNFNYKRVTLKNYNQLTRVRFREIKNINKFRKEHNLDLKLSEPDYKSDSGSSYFYRKINNQTAIIRRSDHWGEVASCKWALGDLNYNKYDRLFGYAFLNEFERI